MYKVVINIPESKSFSRLDNARKYAKQTGKKIYRMFDGKYFVGTYKQAIKRIK